MKRTLKKAMSIFLAAVLLTGLSSVFYEFSEFNAKALKMSEYELNDIIEFGSYPQSKVDDAELLVNLNSLELDWNSYDYYFGNSEDGLVVSNDYMKYADVTYDNQKYRAVIFSDYRPSRLCFLFSEICLGANQEDNGYSVNNIYWFKYEPVEWRVLDPAEGLVLCETIIDSQPYSNSIYYSESDYYNDYDCKTYASDYATSSIREWLNNDFFYTAFTEEERVNLQKCELDNSAVSSSYAQYDSVTTNDKVFLISYDEILNNDYGFTSVGSDNDTLKQAQGSDYAKCQGLLVNSSNGYSHWWLRTPSSNSSIGCFVTSFGSVRSSVEMYFSGYDVIHRDYGVRPVLKLSFETEIVESTEKPDETTKPSTTKTSTPNPDVTELTTKPIEQPTTKPAEETTTKPEVTTEPSTTKPYVKEEIIKKPSTTEVKYGETLILHADFTNIPDDAKIEWSVEGEGVTIKPSEDGKTCVVTSTATGDATITAKYVDANGVEHVSEQEIESNASLWQKIISFFKNLFGISRIIEQRIRF